MCDISDIIILLSKCIKLMKIFGVKLKINKSKQLIINKVLLTVVTTLFLYLLVNIFNNESLIEGVENKGESNTSWTKLSITKQIDSLIDKSDTLTENVLNLSQGDPEKLDYDKLTSIQVLKKTLLTMKDDFNGNSSSIGLSSIKNPFSKSDDNDDNNDNDSNDLYKSTGDDITSAKNKLSSFTKSLF